MPSFPFDGAPHPERDLAGLARAMERVARVLELPEEQLRQPVPAVSGWCAAEHVFHLVLALDLSLRNVTALVRDRGRLLREPEERQEESLAILRRGRIPRGVAETPRFAKPPARFELSLVRELFAEARAVAETLAQDVDALRAAPRTVPHQLIGDLSAAEWARFARLHTTHHLVIAREVLAAQGEGRVLGIARGSTAPAGGIPPIPASPHPLDPRARRSAAEPP